MIRTFATFAIVSAASLTLIGAAQAAGMAGMTADKDGQFYATPIQKGAPTDLPGERMIPGASQAAMAMDTIIGPVAGTLQGVPVAAAEPAPGPMMMRHHRHHHMMMHRHRMMKKKMMMKKM